MSTLLSSDEIESLSNAVRTAQSSGKAARARLREGWVRPYDFARPDKFSKEHMRILNTMHFDYAAGFAATLGALLRVVVRADAVAVEQLSYEDYVASLAEDTLFFQVSLEPLAETAIFEFSPDVVGACIDVLTGGLGTATTHADRLTDVDRAILGRVVDALLKRYVEAWAPYAQIRAEIKDTSRSLSLNQLFASADPVLVCGYEVSVGESTGSMTVCLPAAGLEAMLPSLTADKSASSAPKRDPLTAKAIETSLQEAVLSCRAILGRAALTTEDLIGLQQGDIINLDARPDSEVEVWLGDRLAYWGSPGRFRRKFGVKITREAGPVRKAA